MAGLLAGSLRAHQPPRELPVGGSRHLGRCACDATWLARWCRVPRYAQVDTWSQTTCPADPEDAMATLTCPGCAATVSHDDLICFTCGTNLPRRGPVTEESTPPTVMQEYLRPDGSAAPGTPRPAGPISPVVLRLSFPAGNVDVPAGTSLVLGRDPGESLVAAAFAGYE